MTNIDALVQRRLELDDIIAEAGIEKAAVNAAIVEELGIGSHSVAGVTVSVKNPNRSFNLDRALTFLTDEQRELAMTTAPEASKVKQFLSPVLLDAAMDPGTGNATVTVA
jgi:hypothetical protein